MGQTVLVIVAHPDDEVLGCAGRIARHVDEGDCVHITILAEGETSRNDKRIVDGSSDAIALLHAASQKAADVLGVMSVSHAGYADNRMDSVDLLDVAKVVEARIEEVQPDIIYTHHGGDLNVDHRIAYQAVMTACRPLPGKKLREILTFETLSSTEWSGPAGALGADAFQPNVFVDITKQWDRKRQALEAYQCEMRDYPHPRSEKAVNALAMLRGSACGCEMAEAFMLIRKVER